MASFCDKFQCPQFRHREIIHIKHYFSFLEMYNCFWYLWTCQAVINFYVINKQKFALLRYWINKFCVRSRLGRIFSRLFFLGILIFRLSDNWFGQKCFDTEMSSIIQMAISFAIIFLLFRRRCTISWILPEKLA